MSSSNSRSAVSEKTKRHQVSFLMLNKVLRFHSVLRARQYPLEFHISPLYNTDLVLLYEKLPRLPPSNAPYLYCKAAPRQSLSRVSTSYKYLYGINFIMVCDTTPQSINFSRALIKVVRLSVCLSVCLSACLSVRHIDYIVGDTWGREPLPSTLRASPVYRKSNTISRTTVGNGNLRVFVCSLDLKIKGKRSFQSILI